MDMGWLMEVVVLLTFPTAHTGQDCSSDLNIDGEVSSPSSWRINHTATATYDGRGADGDGIMFIFKITAVSHLEFFRIQIFVCRCGSELVRASSCQISVLIA